MEKEQRQDQCQAFVNFVIDGMDGDRGSDRAMRARLRRADNPLTEYQSWEYLVRFGVNLEDTCRRKAFATIGAALARAKPKGDGKLGIGRAIASAYDDGSDAPQAKARLRRLLACASSEEACDILRHQLRFIASKGEGVCYVRLLRDLLWFSGKTKEQWAQDFYTYTTSETQEEE